MGTEPTQITRQIFFVCPLMFPVQIFRSILLTGYRLKAIIGLIKLQICIMLYKATNLLHLRILSETMANLSTHRALG